MVVTFVLRVTCCLQSCLESQPGLFLEILFQLSGRCCLPGASLPETVLAFPPHDVLGWRVFGDGRVCLGTKCRCSVGRSCDFWAGSHQALRGAFLTAHHPQGHGAL